MTRVSGSDRGQRPKLTPESLHNAPSPVVRIKEAEAFQGRGGRRVFWISTEEPPDHIMFLSVPDLGAVVDRLGDDTAEWAGELLPLELVRRAYNGESYEKYAVPPAEEWGALLKPKAKPRGKKKATRPEAEAR